MYYIVTENIAGFSLGWKWGGNFVKNSFFLSAIFKCLQCKMQKKSVFQDLNFRRNHLHGLSTCYFFQKLQVVKNIITKNYFQVEVFVITGFCKFWRPCDCNDQDSVQSARNKTANSKRCSGGTIKGLSAKNSNFGRGAEEG